MGGSLEGGKKNLEPGQLFALAQMLAIIFRGRTDQILGAYATKMVAVSSPAHTHSHSLSLSHAQMCNTWPLPCASSGAAGWCCEPDLYNLQFRVCVVFY